MPSTNASTWPRLTVINLNRMEVFVIGYYKNEPGYLWSFINISQEHFFENYTEDSFQEKYPNTEIEFTGYVAAGYDQMHISIDGIDQLYEILEDDAILELDF